MLIREVPQSQLSSRSSNVKQRFCALAIFLFIEYLDHARADPWLKITVKVRNQLIFLVSHLSTEMCDSDKEVS